MLGSRNGVHTVESENPLKTDYQQNQTTSFHKDMCLHLPYDYH